MAHGSVLSCDRHLLKSGVGGALGQPACHAKGVSASAIASNYGDIRQLKDGTERAKPPAQSGARGGARAAGALCM